MKKINSFKELENKWILLNKNKEVIFASYEPIEVLEEGKKYPFGEVTIEKKVESSLCFF